MTNFEKEQIKFRPVPPTHRRIEMALYIFSQSNEIKSQAKQSNGEKNIVANSIKSETIKKTSDTTGVSDWNIKDIINWL